MKKNFPYIITMLFFLTLTFGLHNIYATQANPVKIAIIDTAAYLQHPDLKDSIIGGYDFTSNQPIDMNESPTNFHGTHIAGIINNTKYIEDSSPNIQILYYVVDSPNNLAYHQNISKAIYRAIQDGATIINFSGKLSSNLSDIRILQAISFANLSNVIVVKSSGNTGPSLWSVSDLATSSQVLSVGAYDSLTHKLYEHSSRGPAFGSLKIKPDIVAPGVDILSTAPPTNGYYIKATGTSMAAAYVSGALGLITSKRPSLSGYPLVCALSNNATPLVDEYGKTYSVLSQGSGAINVPNTLQTDIICMPHHLSFSLDATSSPTTLTSSLIFTNTSSKKVTYALSFESELDSNSYQLIFPSLVTLMPEEVKNIPVTLSIKDGITPNHYTGRIYIKNALSTKTIPFLLEIPSQDLPIMRGFSLSNRIVSFAQTTDFRFVFETSTPSTLTITATSLDANKSYPLIADKVITTGIHEIGWDGRSLQGDLLPDGLYEISATVSTPNLSTSIADLILLIDNTAPHFQEVSFSEDPNFHKVKVLINDLMISHGYTIDIAYRNHSTPLSPLCIAFSLNGIDYTSIDLEQDINALSFNIPKEIKKLYLRATDFSGNTTSQVLTVPYN